MRQQPHYEKVPFIMITSRGDKDHVVEAVKEGVSEYLGKPFSPEGLSKKIIKVMGRQLKDAMGRSGKSMEGPADAFKESAALLTQKRDTPPAKPAPDQNARAADNPLLAASSAPSPAKKPAAKGSMSVAQVRFADSTLKSVVKDINLTEVRVIAKRDQEFPGILDQAVVDMEIGPEKTARLNGYVHQLQAVDRRQDSDFISVTIRFVDDDPQKMEDLSRFVATFRAGNR
jgi:CheY-like chemotaxis protein